MEKDFLHYVNVIKAFSVTLSFRIYIESAKYINSNVSRVFKYEQVY